MIRIERVAIWIMTGAFALIIPSLTILKFVDELAYVAMLGISLTLCVTTGCWKRFRLLWTIISVMTGYLLYTLVFCRYNTFGAVCADFLIEMKPYVPFAVMLGLAPRLTVTELTALKHISLVNASVAALCLFTGLTETILTHPLYGGAVIFISMLMFLYCSTTLDGGRMSLKCAATVAVMLLCGLGCTRAKYYGETVVAIFVIWIFRPGMFSNIGWRQIAIAVGVVALTIAVAWDKIDFYFITGHATGIDNETIETFARPALYATSLLILLSWIPFGSGLASFASYYSLHPYSGLYYEYGLNNIYGLSPQYPAFVCDAFYPSLAQFGFAGIILFIWFWAKVCGMLRRMASSNPVRFRYTFATGVLTIVFIMIENVASTLFTQTTGVSAMCLLGIICASAASDTEPVEITAPRLSGSRI